MAVDVLEREGEDAVEPGQNGFAVRDEQPEQRLRVRATMKPHASALQAGPEVLMVVEFAVVGEHVPAVRARHRLRPGIARVDDGQPHVSESRILR
jgi:hypothetical protein